MMKLKIYNKINDLIEIATYNAILDSGIKINEIEANKTKY